MADGEATLVIPKLTQYDADIEVLRLRISREITRREARSLSVVGLGRQVGATTFSVALAHSMGHSGDAVTLVDGNAAAPWLR